MKKPVILCIMDGYAIAENSAGNAISLANTPNLDKIFKTYPTTQIGTSGLDVGLPDGQMGNSEVGHTNIGAGRVVYQELTRISKAIKEGTFFENETLIKAVKSAKENNKAVHLIGLLSNGGVHSNIEHTYALLKLCKQYGVEKVFVHAIMDGRDVSPTSGASFLRDLLEEMDKIGCGAIGTVNGRFYAMDRDNRWERVETAYQTIVCGKGDIHKNPVEYVNELYKNDVTDEFVQPFIATENSNITSGDSVIFFNFRPDRARELTRSLVDENFDGFVRENNNLNLNYVCFTQYDASMPNVEIAFKPQSLDNTLGEYVASKGLKQLRISETEKYAHVTFFFNAGVETPYENEDRVLINSPKVSTYDLAPEMSAKEVTDALLAKLDETQYDLVILNYANCDMVGHTGKIDAAIKSVEVVDECMGRLLDKAIELDMAILLTADHGNAEKLLDEEGNVFTAHTTNPVPFSVINYDCSLREGGVLSDIAPTILQILEVEKPNEMTGNSIIK